MNTKTPSKSTNTQQLWTDLGRLVGATTYIQQVWFMDLRAQPPHSPQQPCNQKGTHLKVHVYCVQ